MHISPGTPPRGTAAHAGQGQFAVEAADGSGGAVCPELTSADAILLADALRLALTERQCRGVGSLLKVTTQERVFLLGWRVGAQGEPVLHIGDVYDPGVDITLAASAVEHLAATLVAVSLPASAIG